MSVLRVVLKAFKHIFIGVLSVVSLGIIGSNGSEPFSHELFFRDFVILVLFLHHFWLCEDKVLLTLNL